MIKHEQPVSEVVPPRKLSEVELKDLDLVLSNLIRTNKSVIGAQQVWLEKKGAVKLNGEPNETGYWYTGKMDVIVTHEGARNYDECMDQWNQWHDWPRRSRFDDLFTSRFPNPKKFYFSINESSRKS